MNNNLHKREQMNMEMRFDKLYRCSVHLYFQNMQLPYGNMVDSLPSLLPIKEKLYNLNFIAGLNVLYNNYFIVWCIFKYNTMYSIYIKNI